MGKKLREFCLVYNCGVGCTCHETEKMDGKWGEIFAKALFQCIIAGWGATKKAQVLHR